MRIISNTSNSPPPPAFVRFPFWMKEATTAISHARVKRGAPTSSIGFSERIQLQPLGLKESFAMHEFPWRHGLKNGKIKKKHE